MTGLHPSARLSANCLTLRLEISGDLDASMLSALIVELGVIRAQMLPPVPADFASRADPGPEDLPVSQQVEASFALRRMGDGRLRLYLRNEGLGCLLFEIHEKNAVTLRDYLELALAGKPVSDLFSDQIAGSDRPQ